MKRTGMDGPPYLLLKANAGQMPLANDSVSLVIATPPYIGAERRRKDGYCTSDPDEYRARITRFLAEAVRIVKPSGHILLISSRPRIGKTRGARRIEFDLLQKRASRDRWTRKRIKSEKFLTHYVDVEDFPWWALPVRLYRSLIDRYSYRGEIIAHVFSGSGNGGIAALELARKPILIDLHYQRQIKRRLDKKIQTMRRRMTFPFVFPSFALTSFASTPINRSISHCLILPESTSPVGPARSYLTREVRIGYDGA